MKLYLDTSALAKLYYPEPESAAVERWVRKQGGSILFTPLHELELTNAFALKLFRKEITQDQLDSVLDTIDQDRSAKVLEAVSPDNGDLYRRAVRLAKEHTSQMGTRSLDVAHVAAALIAACDAFLTNDERQFRLAKAAGLDAFTVAGSPVPPIGVAW